MFSQNKRLLLVTSPSGALIDLPFYMYVKGNDVLTKKIHEPTRYLDYTSFSNEKLMYISTDDVRLHSTHILSYRSGLVRLLQEIFQSKSGPFSILLKSSIVLCESFSISLSDLQDVDIIYYQIQASEELCKLSLHVSKLPSQVSHSFYENKVKFIRYEKNPVKWKSIKVHLNATEDVREKIFPEIVSLWKTFPQDVVE